MVVNEYDLVSVLCETRQYLSCSACGCLETLCRIYRKRCIDKLQIYLQAAGILSL